jgi:hypothetical protein
VGRLSMFGDGGKEVRSAKSDKGGR